MLNILKKLKPFILKNFALLIMAIILTLQPHKIQRMSEEIQLEEKEVKE